MLEQHELNRQSNGAKSIGAQHYQERINIGSNQQLQRGAAALIRACGLLDQIKEGLGT